MSFKNKLSGVRRNSKYRLGLIAVLLVIVGVLFYFAKSGVLKVALGALAVLLFGAGMMETTGNDYDVQKLIETKSFSASKIEKGENGMWKVSDPKCQKDTINCSNFKTQKEAQDMFEYCGGTTGDKFRLDGDKDGKACEMLPAGV